MKHLVYFSLLGIIFLVGCGHKPKFLPPIIEPTIEQPKLLETILPPDTGTYPNPKINISIGVGRVVQGMNENPEKKYEWTKKIEDGREFFESTETGYIYTYTYSDLGIKIITPPLYPPYFYEKSEGLILKRNGNIIFLSGTTNVVPDYIEVFYKNSQISFEEEIRKNHLPTGCIIQTGIFDKNWTFYPSMIGFEYILIASVDGNLAPNGKIFDKQFPENLLNISFVMDPKKPNKYYKLSHGDCAPGPCTIFGNIEFF